MSEETGDPLPLKGLTVLEMGSSISGPSAGRIFGDMGATILKVELPEVGEASCTWGKERLGGRPSFSSIQSRQTFDHRGIYQRK